MWKGNRENISHTNSSHFELCFKFVCIAFFHLISGRVISWQPLSSYCLSSNSYSITGQMYGPSLVLYLVLLQFPHFYYVIGIIRLVGIHKLCRIFPHFSTCSMCVYGGERVFPSCRSQGLNIDCQAWWQAPWPTEPSCWPSFEYLSRPTDRVAISTDEQTEAPRNKLIIYKTRAQTEAPESHNSFPFCQWTINEEKNSLYKANT